MSSDNPVQEFDRVVSGLCKIAAIGHFRGMLRDANETDARRCGNCIFWMKSSECPKEGRLNGRRVGPNCNSPACGKFEIEQWVVELKQKRLHEARQYAFEQGLAESV